MRLGNSTGPCAVRKVGLPPLTLNATQDNGRQFLAISGGKPPFLTAQFLVELVIYRRKDRENDNRRQSYLRQAGVCGRF